MIWSKTLQICTYMVLNSSLFCFHLEKEALKQKIIHYLTISS